MIVLAIFYWIWAEGAMLGLLWMRMFVVEQLFGNVYISFVVVPVKRYAAVQIASPILNNVIGFVAKGSKQVSEIVVADVFYPKVIDT